MLIIVESPAKAKTISKILEQISKKYVGKTSKKHIVKASYGHVRKLSDKKIKSAKGEKLTISGIDIDNGFKPLYEIDSNKLKIVKELQTLAQAAQDGILFATDEDREGEAISWHLAELLGIPAHKVKRMVFHEITELAIEEAIKNPRPLNLSLVTAQQARQVLDKLVGYGISPVLWGAMGNHYLSAGRVQSPALKLVVDREKAIQAHIPEEYWEVQGYFVPLQALQTQHLLEQIFSPEVVRSVINSKNNKIKSKSELE